MAHAFSTRLGGSSPPPFDSFNLGNPNGCPVQDDYARIWDHYAQLQSAIGRGDGQLCRVHQVHGAEVVEVAGLPWDSGRKADALVTMRPEAVLSVRVADCVPVLIAGADGRAVAAAHAGWRGVVGGVVPQAIGELRRLGGYGARQVIVAIGPCIGFDAFEVGDEVLDAFARVFPDAPELIRRCGDGKGHIDLRGAARRQAIEMGIDPVAIDTTDRCTFTHAKEFYSHRRDAGVTGRMAALIATAR